MATGYYPWEVSSHLEDAQGKTTKWEDYDLIKVDGGQMTNLRYTEV